MKLKIMLATLALVALNGCSTLGAIEKAMLCTEHSREYFVNRNAELSKQRAEVEAMLGWTHTETLFKTGTMLTAKDYKEVMVIKYNERVAQLEGQVANYNKVCVAE